MTGLSAIGQSIEALCTEQGLDREMVIEAMKEAVKAAARKRGMLRRTHASAHHRQRGAHKPQRSVRRLPRTHRM